MATPHPKLAAVCLLAALCLSGCGKNPTESSVAPLESPAPAIPGNAPPRHDPSRSVVRVNSTLQSWNLWQPWEKDAPVRRRALGAIVAPGLVLTTAEMAADSTFMELESIDGTRFSPARTVAVDHEANLALLAARQDESSQDFFAGMEPFPIASAPAIGDDLDLLQVEANGRILQTGGTFQGVDLSSTAIPGGGFLTYTVKASMQDAASSYSLPVLHQGKLSGLLFSYDSKDQLCEVAATEIMTRFLQRSSSGPWAGFPSLGVGIATTEDPAFRQWLKLGEEQGGIYVRSVRRSSAAESAGIRKGDVLLSIDGLPIDRRGYCVHPAYGNLLWAHWIRGEKSIGDTASLTLWRDGAALRVTAALGREDPGQRLVPTHLRDQAPNFVVKGGLVFQELSLPLLQAFGKDWESVAPLDLLDAYQNPESREENVRRIVFLSGVIPTPATVGYESLRSLIVGQVNGKPVRDMRDLHDAFESGAQAVSTIRFANEPLTIHLDESIADEVDSQLLQRGIRKMSRTDGKP